MWTLRQTFKRVHIFKCLCWNGIFGLNWSIRRESLSKTLSAFVSVCECISVLVSLFGFFHSFCLAHLSFWMRVCLLCQGLLCLFPFTWFCEVFLCILLRIERFSQSSWAFLSIVISLSLCPHPLKSLQFCPGVFFYSAFLLGRKSQTSFNCVVFSVVITIFSLSISFSFF